MERLFAARGDGFYDLLFNRGWSGFIIGCIVIILVAIAIRRYTPGTQENSFGFRSRKGLVITLAVMCLLAASLFVPGVDELWSTTIEKIVLQFMK